MAETGGFSRGKTRHFRAWSWDVQAQTNGLNAFMSLEFSGARPRENGAAPLCGEDRIYVTRGGRVRPDAADLLTCGRHGEAAQMATLPWRGVSLS
jgi:hypothetical protein